MSIPPTRKRILVAPTTIDSEELWLPVNYKFHPEIKQIYFVSSFGRVFSHSRDRFCSQEISNTGYFRVSLVLEENVNKSKHLGVHRLVLEAFNPIDNCENLIVNHIDANKLNNRLDNLEWTTYQGNALHAIRNGLINWRTGDDCSWSTIDYKTADKIGEMIKLGYAQYYIARKFGISNAIVHNIAFGISWTNVYVKYKLWRYKISLKETIISKNIILVREYIKNNIHKYDDYRYLCMDLYKDLFNLPLDRDSYVNIMDEVYTYLDNQGMI